MADPVTRAHFRPFDLTIDSQEDDGTIISGAFTYMDDGIDFDEGMEEQLTKQLVHGLIPIIMQEGELLKEKMEQATCAMADRYFYDGKYEKALEHYYIALDQAKPHGEQATAPCYYRIANLLRVLKRYPEAETVFRVMLPCCGGDLKASCLEGLAATMHKQGNLQGALIHYEEALSIYQAADDRLSCLCGIATVLQGLENYVEALRHLETASKIIEESECEVGLELMTFQILRDVLTANNQYQEAINTSHKALAKEMPEYKKAQFLNGLGAIYRQSSDLENALKYHKEALCLLDSLSPSDEAQLTRVFTLHDFVLTYARLSRLDEAKECYERACTITQELFVPGVDPMAASSFDGFAFDSNVLLFDEFDELYLAAKEAKEAIFGQNASEHVIRFETGLVAKDTIVPVIPSVKACRNSAILLRNHGLLHEAKKVVAEAERCLPAPDADLLDVKALLLRDLGSLTEAKSILEQVIEIRRENWVESERNEAQLANSLDHMGNVLKELGHFKEAREALVEALVLREGLFDADHPAVILSLNSLGQLLYEIGEYEDAHHHLKVSYDRVGANFYSLMNLGKLLLEQGETEAAMRYFKMALYRTSKSANPLAVQERERASSLECVGHCLGHLGKHHDAYTMQNEAYALRVHHFGRNSYQAASSLCSMGYYADRMGHFDEALVLYEDAIKIQKSYFGDEHHTVANTLDSMGACYTKLDQHEKAQVAHLEALKIRLSVFGECHPLVAQSLDNIAFSLSHLGKKEEVFTLFQEALSIREQFFDSKHPLVQLSRSYIAGCRAPFKAGEEATGHLVTRDEFETLVHYALSYLENIEDLSTVTFEKNPTGFVRLRLPVPKGYEDKIETVRLNFWTSNVTIKTVEAPHNHPRYFESMIIQGGYTHNLFHEVTSTTNYVTNRIFKGATERRDILHAGALSLQLKSVVEVQAGQIVAFPISLIHQVLTTLPNSMSINCVLKHEDNRNYYDVFLPRYSEQDPQVERETLLSDETAAIALQMKEVLLRWKEAHQKPLELKV